MKRFSIAALTDTRDAETLKQIVKEKVKISIVCKVLPLLNVHSSAQDV